MDDVFVYFESLDTEFCLYSHEDGYILDDGQFTLVVPDKEHMVPNYVMKHSFPDDGIRYMFLKSMYGHIEEWGSCWNTFRNDGEPDHDLIIHNQFWVY